MLSENKKIKFAPLLNALTVTNPTLLAVLNPAVGKATSVPITLPVGNGLNAYKYVLAAVNERYPIINVSLDRQVADIP